MSKLQQQTDMLGLGTLALGLLLKLRQDCDKMGVTRTLLTMGVAELNGMTAPAARSFSKDGVVDVSPPPQDIPLSRGFEGRQDLVERYWEVIAPLLDAMADKVIQTRIKRGLFDGELLFVAGITGGHRFLMDYLLRRLKTSLPRQSILALSALPHEPMKRQRLRESYDLFLKLRQQELVDVTILVDNAGPFAAAHTLQVMDAYVTRAVASLLAAQVQLPSNPSWVEVLHYLGEQAAHLGMAFARRQVHLEQTVPGARWLGLQRGSTSVEHLVEESKVATVQTLTERTARALDEPVQVAYPAAVVYTVPLPLQGPGAQEDWAKYAGALRGWLEGKYPEVTPIFASGNASPAAASGRKWELQVTALYPIPDVPAPMQQALERRRFSEQRDRSGVGASNVDGRQPTAALEATQIAFPGR